MGYPGYNSALQKEYIITSWIWSSVHLTHIMRVVFACVLLVCFVYLPGEMVLLELLMTVSCFIVWTMITPGTLWNILLRRLTTGDLKIWTLDDLTFNIRVYRTQTRLTCQCSVAYLYEVSRVCIPLWHQMPWTKVQGCETVVITFTMPAIRQNSYDLWRIWLSLIIDFGDTFVKFCFK